MDVMVYLTEEWLAICAKQPCVLGTNRDSKGKTRTMNIVFYSLDDLVYLHNDSCLEVKTNVDAQKVSIHVLALPIN